MIVGIFIGYLIGSQYTNESFEDAIPTFVGQSKTSIQKVKNAIYLEKKENAAATSTPKKPTQ